MRICVCTDTALPKLGGQELVVDALARQYVKLGHEPIVFAPKPRKLSIRGERYPYEVVRHPRYLSSRFLVGWYRLFLGRLYRQRRFDVLHCHGIYPAIYLVQLLGKSLPVPVVVTSHGGDLYEHNVRLCKPVVQQRCVEGLSRADALVAISRFTREGYTRLNPEIESRIVDIPNGVHVADHDTPARKPAEWDPRLKPGSYMLFLGRLKRRKGVDLLLQALARATGARSLSLVIAGDGEERESLEQQSRELGLEGRVHFVGAMRGEAKSYLLQHARFLVVPSRDWEAFPLVVLESYASGLPVVGTWIPGLGDLIEEGVTGLVVPPESPEQLAGALNRLAQDEALNCAMGLRARKRAAAYDWKVIAQRHLALYEKLVGEKSAEPGCSVTVQASA